jgi:hypothetical protein
MANSNESQKPVNTPNKPPTGNPGTRKFNPSNTPRNPAPKKGS